MEKYQQPVESLCRANLEAAQLVIALVREQQREQIRWLCRQLRAVAQRIPYSLRYCQRIEGDVYRSYTRVEFIVHSPSLSGGRPESSEAGNDNKKVKRPAAHAAWADGLEALVWIIDQAVHHLSVATRFSDDSTREALTCLANLSQIVLRQQRYVVMMDATTTEVVFRVEQ